MDRRLSTPAAIALYVGAVLGPGVLLTPALVARAAGPASVIDWAALLVLSVPLAITFAALGVRFPHAGGTAEYARAAFGATAGRVTGWLFLAAVLVGAPVVAYAGGRYVAAVAGFGTAGAATVAVAIVAVVLVVNAIGLHATARVQLAVAGGLAVLLALAVATALPQSRAGNWTPFAPHGWTAVGSAASVLMFSFIGWEAVSHLVGDLRDPRRQLPRAIGGALLVITLLYAGLAVATISVLDGSPRSDVPIADLMATGLGETGRRATIGVAVLLTLGTMSTYVAGALRLAGTLTPRARPGVALPVLAVVTAVLLGGLAAGVVSASDLTRGSTACFIAVYVLATSAGVRLLRGGARVAAAVCAIASAAILAFAGVALLVPVVVAAAALAGAQSAPGRKTCATQPSA